MTTRTTLPTRRDGDSVEFEHRGHKFTGNCGRYDDGRVGEVFLHSGKTGTHLSITMQEASIACSFALQHGADINKLRLSLLRDDDGKAAGPLGHFLDLLTGAEK